ncbi:MAG: hypothetical protein KGZ58_14155 [Ignavibacteriales bacterium]|nr:hypothetical protein [Ignavibacteriales bacterium]
MLTMNDYLETIRTHICSKCINRTSSGVCTPDIERDCALIQFLPEIVRIVNSTQSESYDDYVSALRDIVCAQCKESPQGVCSLRDDVECAVDRYYPLVIEAIQLLRAARVANVA